jgi:hypothetical protein
MSKYSKFKFFDSNSDELNLKYDSTKQSWEGIVYLPEVSTGLYETLTIYMLEEVVSEINSTQYVKPIAETTSVNNNILVSFENEYDSSGNIILYTSSVEGKELFIKSEKTQLKTRLANPPYTENADGLKIVSSTLPSEPIQINVALKSDIETYHRRTLIIDEINAAGSITGRIATIRVYGETVGEDERLETLLSNIGMSLTPTDHFVFEDADIRESSPDWKLINRKRRELLLEAANIKPFIGTYKALLNAIKYFGYENITLEEYWLNINETAENFGKLKAVAVPNQSVKGFLAAKNSTSELPNSNLKKTSRFSLVYRLNNATGEYDEWDIPKVKEALEFSPDEVLIKLYGLKNRLQKSYIPMHAKIVDIVGAGDYFSQFNINTWNNQQNISSVNEGVDIDYEVFPKRGLYLEDLRKVNPWLTGKGQDFNALDLLDLGAYWKVGKISDYPAIIDDRDYNNIGELRELDIDHYSTDSPNNETTGSIVFPTLYDGHLVSAKHPDLEPSNEITVSIWAKLTAEGFSSNNSTPGTEVTGWGIETPVSTSKNWTMISNANLGGWRMYWGFKRFGVYLSAGGNVLTNNIGTTGLTSDYNPFSLYAGSTDTSWHMFSFTFDGRYARLYIDGVPAASTNTNSAWAGTTFDGVSMQNGGNAKFDMGSYGNTLDYGEARDLFIGSEPNGATPVAPEPDAQWVGNISNTGIISRALNAEEMLECYNEQMGKYFGREGTIAGSIEKFYNDYESTDMSTFSDINIPVGCPIILKANSLKDTWNDCDATYDDANGGKEFTYGRITIAERNAITGLGGADAIGQLILKILATGDQVEEEWNGTAWIPFYNGFTWDKWWHKNVYEIEWTITGPEDYNRTFRRTIDQGYELALTLPYTGEYSVDLSFYDLYNVRSFKAGKNIIEVKSKEVETYAITQSKSPVLNWNRYHKYSWSTAGSDWDTAAENTSSIDDFVGSYYLTMNRDNYANNSADWKHSTVVRYRDDAATSGFSETAGPYALNNMKNHNWNDGATMSWDMTRVGGDLLAGFKIVFEYDTSGVPGSTNRSHIIVKYLHPTTGADTTEQYTLLSYPTATTDITGWTAAETELNGLNSTTYPVLSQFTYNLVIEDTNADGDTTDQGTDTCKFILGVAKAEFNSKSILQFYHNNSTATAADFNRVSIPSYNLHESFNPTYVDTKVINQHDIYNKLNHFTFSFDNSKVPGILSHEWSIKNNSKNIGDIYYNNRWLTYVFDEKGDYTIGLKLTDVNGNKMETTKNILTIK